MLAATLASAGIDVRRAEDAAQLISPVGMQVICAPLHLLALNMYNMPQATLRQRAAAVASTAPQTILAYAVRMAPAFGIGGVMNSALTARGREALRAPHDEHSPTHTPGSAAQAAISRARLSATMSH